MFLKTWGIDIFMINFIFELFANSVDRVFILIRSLIAYVWLYKRIKFNKVWNNSFDKGNWNYIPNITVKIICFILKEKKM